MSHGEVLDPAHKAPSALKVTFLQFFLGRRPSLLQWASRYLKDLMSSNQCPLEVLGLLIRLKALGREKLGSQLLLSFLSLPKAVLRRKQVFDRCVCEAGTGWGNCGQSLHSLSIPSASATWCQLCTLGLQCCASV